MWDCAGEGEGEEERMGWVDVRRLRCHSSLPPFHLAYRLPFPPLLNSPHLRFLSLPIQPYSLLREKKERKKERKKEAELGCVRMYYRDEKGGGGEGGGGRGGGGEEA